MINAVFGVTPDLGVTGAGTRVRDATHTPDVALLPVSNESCVGFG